MHKFEIVETAGGQFRVQFFYNAEIVVWSENYATKANAESCIDSVRANAPNAAVVDVVAGESGSGYRFEIKESSDKQYYVLFMAPNGEPIVNSERHTTKASARACIESVQKNAPEAPVELRN